MRGYLHHPALRRALAVLLWLLSLGLVTWANYSTLASQSDGMASQDFMSLWTGGKTIVMGIDPYDANVWRPLRASYGSTLLNDSISPYPAWTLLFFVPFSYLTVQTAGAVWMTLCELAVVVGIFKLARSLGWKDRAPFLLLLGAVAFRPLLPSITHGQLVPVLFLLLVGAHLLYQQGHPFAAGFVLALQAAKPNLALFLFLTAGWIFLVRREWRVLAGLVAGGLVLLIASWVALPGWLFQYFKNTEKTRSTRRMPTVWGLTLIWGGPKLWPGTAIAVSLVFYLGMLLLIWRHREEDWLFSLSLAVIAATFLTPYAWAYEQLVLLFVNITALRWGLASMRGPRWAWWAGWWLVGSVMSWVFFMFALQRELDVISALIPLLSLGYLVLARHAFRTGRLQSAPAA